ncbi:MAG: UDP-N-acetylmuramate dehydrogenase [Lachnospiraceae bacterium]|nr:UDP-N-acetylmuramate dehydrogenase [Lachnospiraceae bacterium]
MKNTEIVQTLQELIGADAVLTDELMKQHTTFRIGGPADLFVMPGSAKDVMKVLAVLRNNHIPYFIMGNGSNLLVSDEGYRGCVVQIGSRMSEIREEDGILECGAGALLSQIAAAARAESLAGFEFASGIPGTLGGACVMNAGAYGGEMKDVLAGVTVLDKEGNVQKYAVDELELGYRTSRLLKEESIVLSAKIRLEKGDPEEILAKTEELRRKRVEKQPIEMPSAGSTFKRPEGYFAGKLIEDAGLRGFGIGGAQVSEKHCGFVVNSGDATAADVQALITEIQCRVYEMAGVDLETEVRFLGEF